MAESSVEKLVMILSDIREDKLSFGGVTKADLWSSLKLLLSNPAIGLKEEKDAQAYHDELRRIVSAHLSSELPTPGDLAFIVGGKLSFQTLLVLNSFVHKYIIAIADAKEIYYENPGAMEAVSSRIKESVESSNPVKPNISIPFTLATSILELFLHLGLEGETLASTIASEEPLKSD